MNLSRRDALASALFAIAGVLTHTRTAGAQRKRAMLAQSTLDLEHAINWMLVGPSWGRQRFAWVDAVRAAHTPNQLAGQIVALESALGRHGVTPAWATQRGPWLAAAGTARTDAAVAHLLVTLEAALAWGATNSGWHVTRPRWIAALNAIH